MKKSFIFLLMIMAVFSCRRSGGEKKEVLKYKFSQGETIKYRIEASGQIKAAALGFVIKETPKISGTIGIFCLTNQGGVVKLRLNLHDIKLGGLSRILPSRSKHMIRMMKRPSGVILYMEENGKLLNYSRGTGRLRSFNIIEHMIIHYLLIPVLKGRLAEQEKQKLQFRTRGKSFNLGFDSRKDVNDKGVIFHKKITLLRGSALNAKGSVNIKQTFSKVFGRLVSINFITAFKWNMRFKKGIFNLSIPASLKLFFRIRLL